MRKGRKINPADVIPFAAFLILFLFFSVASRGKMLSAYNLRLLVEQSIQTIIVGCGVLFVVAQGSIDLSVGVNLALSGVVGMHIAILTGQGWLLIPVSILCGGLIGLLNGFLVSKCKVPSFTLSIAIEYAPESVLFITSSTFRIICFAVIAAFFCYLFEFTRMGRYSQAIGENERTVIAVGIPVTRYKILAFVISGLLAGVGAVFSIGSVGGTSMQMGVFLEMKVAMAIFFGGVLVTGGSSAKFYKVILGSLSITVMLLLIILFITIVASRHRIRKKN